MADYNVKTLIDNVLDEAKDESIPRSRILRYLQYTQDQVLGRHIFKFSEYGEDVTLTTAAVVHTPDCDLQQITHLTLSGDGMQEAAQPEYVANQAFFERFPNPEALQPGVPQFYTDFGGDIYWDRPLDKPYRLGLRGISASGQLKDNDRCRPLIPREFDEIYMLGALARVEKRRENHDIAAVYERELEDKAEDFLGRYAPRKRGPGKARTIHRRMGNQ